MNIVKILIRFGFSIQPFGYYPIRFRIWIYWEKLIVIYSNKYQNIGSIFNNMDESTNNKEMWKKECFFHQTLIIDFAVFLWIHFFILFVIIFLIEKIRQDFIVAFGRLLLLVGVLYGLWIIYQVIGGEFIR